MEGYPGLLTHGPLEALAMAEAARPSLTGADLTYEYRLVAPLFDHQGLIVRAVAEDGQVRTSARDRSGRIAAHGTITADGSIEWLTVVYVPASPVDTGTGCPQIFARDSGGSPRIAPRSPNVDASTLGLAPFRGSVAVAGGLVTPRQLQGPYFRRIFHDVYVSASTTIDHLTMCQAAALLLPVGGALSHETAALFYNVPPFVPGRRRVHLSVPPECRRTVVHRAGPPVERDHRQRGGFTTAGQQRVERGTAGPRSALRCPDRSRPPGDRVTSGWAGAAPAVSSAGRPGAPHVSAWTGQDSSSVGAGLQPTVRQYTVDVETGAGSLVARWTWRYEQGLRMAGIESRRRPSPRSGRPAVMRCG